MRWLLAALGVVGVAGAGVWWWRRRPVKFPDGSRLEPLGGTPFARVVAPDGTVAGYQNRETGEAFQGGLVAADGRYAPPPAAAVNVSTSAAVARIAVEQREGVWGVVDARGVWRATRTNQRAYALGVLAAVQLIAQRNGPSAAVWGRMPSQVG